MTAEKVPLFKLDDGSYAPAFHWVPYAYHLENRRFVGFRVVGLRILLEVRRRALVNPSHVVLKFARRGNNLFGDFWAWMPIIGPSASGIIIIRSADGLQYWRRS